MRRSCVFLVAALGMSAGSQGAEPFRGWETLRTIRQDGMPGQVRAADLDGDGRDEIVIVNTRQSRLDLYEWLPAGEREAAPAPDPKRPNDLPMAPEFRKEELAFNELPRDVECRDVDGDGTLELIVLVSPPNKVLVYGRDEETKKWSERDSWDLLPGTIEGRDRAVLVRTAKGGEKETFELLISFSEGIQTLRLEPSARASWLSPRERRGRTDWWLFDLDADGDLDLVEWSTQAGQTLRWYEATPDGLLPAQLLYKHAADAVGGILRADGTAEILVLGGLQPGLLRRHVMALGEENPLGRHEVLPLPGEGNAVWTGIELDGRNALAATDPSQPRLLVHILGEKGWLPAETFPIISNVQALAAPRGQPGTLLLWAKDAGDLHVSRWENGRFSYPRPMPQSEEVEDRRIVALEAVGRTVWWAQKVAKDLDLYVWEPDQTEPAKTRFTGVGEKAEKVTWLGGERLVLLEKYARSPKLVTRDAEGAAQASEPAHVKKASIEQFRLIDDGSSRRLALLVDGVLQWLDEGLHPADQIMLPEGARLSSFVPIPGGQAWALQQGGEEIHRLEPDRAGILRVVETLRVAGGSSLVDDPVLGILLTGTNSVARLTRGRPFELKALQTIDSREGRPSGVKEATIHRLMTTDVTGDGAGEVLLFDDERHQVTVLGRGEEDQLEALLSWPVFEDRAYPYGQQESFGRRSEGRSEPRAVVGLDADGDKHQDLVLLCHDRLLIYLGRKEG